MDSSRAHRLFAALDAIWIGDPTGDWITESAAFTRFAESGGCRSPRRETVCAASMS